MIHFFYNQFSFLLLSLLILITVSSCTPHSLDVQTRYLNAENLASYHIGTPDPHLDQPTLGQRLLIQWSLSSQEFQQHPVFLYLTLRLRNHQQRELKVLLSKKRGYYLYDLIDQDYCETGGLQTYQVEIRNDTCLIASWKHPLWAELITFDFSQRDEIKDDGR